jgi:BarA-like signal transduction histidine kinase
MNLLEDFEPYPMKEALTRAFKLTDNVILKLPKNINISQLLSDIVLCYQAANP